VVNAGIVVITNPALVKKMPIVVTARARLRKEDFGVPERGGAAEAG
jgi:hypothetical protein